MQEGKQPLRARVQLFARLTLNAGEDAANQPARLAQLDDGNDRAILVQGNQGPAQIVRLGHRGTPSIDVSDEIAILAARPIASLRWRAGGRWIRTSSTAAREPGIFPTHSGWPLAHSDRLPRWASSPLASPCRGSRGLGCGLCFV